MNISSSRYGQRTTSHAPAILKGGLGPVISFARKNAAAFFLLGTVLLFGASRAGAGIDYWIGGTDLNWSTAGNWASGAVPVFTNDVFFTDTNASAGSPPFGSPDNVVDASMTIESLFYTNDSGFHTTMLNPGVTLTITNGLPVANVAFGTIPTAIFVGTGADEGVKAVYATITGSGAVLQINAPTAIVNTRQGSVTFNASTLGTLDLSLLDTFHATINRMLAGGDGSSGANERGAGVIWLAYTNIIDFTSTSNFGLTIGDRPGTVTVSAPLSTVYLGNTNTILSDYGMLISGKDAQGTLKYNPYNSYGPADGSLFRNQAGTGRQSFWQIGDQSTAPAYTSGGSTGIADFSLAPVDAMVDQLVIGRAQPFSTSSVVGAGSYGTLTFSAGTINVNTALVCYRPTVNGCPAGGVINVNGTANLIINSNLTIGVAGATTNLTVISSGALIVNGGTATIGGNIIDGFGPTNAVIVENGGTLNLGGLVGSAKTSSQGPLANFILNNGTFNINRGFQGNPVGGLCTVSNLSTSFPVSVNVSASALYIGQFPLISYQNWSGSFSDLTITLSPSILGYVSNNVANKSIDLVVTNIAADFWNGKNGATVTGVWDINITPDWLNVNGVTPTTYKEPSIPGDAVVFDDTATGTTTVTLNTTVSPSTIDINNTSKTYSITGSGAIGGPGGILKNGTGTFTIANTGSNGFAGAVTVNAGTLQLGGAANRLPATAVVNLATNTVLDLNNQNQTIASVAGSGIVTLGSGTLTLGGESGTLNNIISGSGSLVFSNSGTTIIPYTNTYSGGTIITSNATVSVITTNASGLGTGNIDIEGGILYIGSTAAGLGGAYGNVAAAAITNNVAAGGALAQLLINRSDTYTESATLYGSGQFYLTEGTGRTLVNHANFQTGETLASFGPIQISDPNALGSGFLLIGSLAAAALELSNNITVPNPITITAKASAPTTLPAAIINVSGTNTLSGPITFATGVDWSLRSDAGKLFITGAAPISTVTGTLNYRLRGNSDGEITQGLPGSTGAAPNIVLYKDGTGTWTIDGNSTYNSSTVVSNGTLILNGNVQGTFNVPSASIQVYGGTLAGNGKIAIPNVYIYAGGTLAPGTATNQFGTITLTNNLRLIAAGSTVSMDVSHVAYDQINGIAQMNWGGGIIKVNLAGPVQAGDVFHLFNFQTFIGAIGTTNLPALPNLLSWDASQLTTAGILRVVGPSIGSIVQNANGTVSISGTAPGATSANTYRILASTNISTALTNWLQVGSGNLSGGTFSFTDNNATNFSSRFYILVSP